MLRQLREAMAEEEVRRTMQGEDLLLRDSMLLARQVEHRDRLLTQERQRAQRAEQERRLHGPGQDAEATAAARAVASLTLPGRRTTLCTIRSSAPGEGLVRDRCEMWPSNGQDCVATCRLLRLEWYPWNGSVRLWTGGPA